MSHKLWLLVGIAIVTIVVFYFVRPSAPLLPGMVWYEIPELGVKFQIKAELAKELIYTTFSNIQNSQKQVSVFGSNMTGSTLFFSVSPIYTESKNTEDVEVIDFTRNEGVLFSTKKVTAIAPSCDASSGPLGLLFAGSFVEAYVNEIAQNSDMKPVKRYTDKGFVMAYRTQNCSYLYPDGVTDSVRTAEAREAIDQFFGGKDEMVRFWPSVLSTMTKL